MKIIRAAEILGIYYPTAKAIYKVYETEDRIKKKPFRYRAKPEDAKLGVTPHKIAVEILPRELKSLEVAL